MTVATTSTLNPRWVLSRRPDGLPGDDDLRLEEARVPALADGEVRVRNIYLSLDPTNRLWMSDREQYLPPVGIGDVMRGTTIGVVEESRSPKFAPGDLAMPSAGGWQLYATEDARTVRKVGRIDGVPLTAHLSILGVTGLTAYFGLLDVAALKEGDVVVITAAAGAVGSVAGQIAKIKGCRVIGIAGGARKCRWLVDELGFDGAIDYKAEDVGTALDRLCPDGIDVGFENVGGAIMDAVFDRLRQNGRMAVCGLISSYNLPGRAPGPAGFERLLMKRLTIRGFIIIDYLGRGREAFGALGAWIGAGRLRWKDHVVPGLEEAPAALHRLFSGDHDGKLIVRISPEP